MKISNKVNFSQNNYIQTQLGYTPQTQVNNGYTQQCSQYQHQPVTTMPAVFMNPTIPTNYTKLGVIPIQGTDTLVHLYKLANGQTVALAPKKGKTQINTYIRCGSMNETDNIRGISHFIEHNLFNGSEKIKPKELFETINKMGAYTNAWTSEETTSYTIQSHLFDSEDLGKIIELHADMIQNPKFEQAQIDKEKGVVNSEITMYDDNNIKVVMGKALKQLFNIKSESNDLVGGTVKNINKLTREDVVNYYNKNYTPDRMITVLTGEFDPQNAIEMISKNFTKKAPQTVEVRHHEPLIPIEKQVRSDITSPLITNDEFVISLCGPKNNNLKENYAVNIILSMLAGAKHTKLERNLQKYNVKPDMGLDRVGNKPSDPGAISIIASSDPKETENVLKTIYSTIHNMRNENLSDAIETQKRALLKNMNQLFETGDGVNNFVGEYLKNYSPNEIQNYAQIISSITEADIKSALAKYFDMNKASLVVSHPEKTETNAANNSLKPAFKGRLQKSGLNLGEFQHVRLQNNAEVYLKNDNSALKHFVLRFNSTVPPNVNPMVPVVLEELLTKGSIFKSEADFSEDLAKRSALLKIKTDQNGLTMWADALNGDIDYTLGKVVELLMHPKFDQKSLEDVKSYLTKQVKDSKPSPIDYVKSTFFPQFKSAIKKEDKLKALNEVTLGDILGFCEYIKQNSTMYFGWNKPEIPSVLTTLGQFKSAQKEDFRTFTPLQENVIKTQIYNAGQAKVIRVYNYRQEKSARENAKIAIMNNILGAGQASRLFTDLRENQKLAYSTGSYIDTCGDTGLAILSIGTTTDNTQDLSATSENITKSLEGFDRNINKLKTEPVSAEELEAAKLSAKSGILNSLETNADKTNGLISSVFMKNNPNFINELLSEIDKVTVNDVQETAQKVFGGKSLTSIVASKKTLDELNLTKYAD